MPCPDYYFIIIFCRHIYYLFRSPFGTFLPAHHIIASIHRAIGKKRTATLTFWQVDSLPTPSTSPQPLFLICWLSPAFPPQSNHLSFVVVFSITVNLLCCIPFDNTPRDTVHPIYSTNMGNEDEPRNRSNSISTALSFLWRSGSKSNQTSSPSAPNDPSGRKHQTIKEEEDDEVDRALGKGITRKVLPQRRSTSVHSSPVGSSRTSPRMEPSKTSPTTSISQPSALERIAIHNGNINQTLATMNHSMSLPVTSAGGEDIFQGTHDSTPHQHHHQHHQHHQQQPHMGHQLTEAICGLSYDESLACSKGKQTEQTRNISTHSPME